MSVNNYKHPNVKQQWGLADDPNGSDHVVTSKGHRLTRTLTAGGHEVDSSQPGFPIYHRRIANPFPLMCISTGASLLMLGFILVRIRNITNPAICKSSFILLQRSVYSAEILPVNTFLTRFAFSCGFNLLSVTLQTWLWVSLLE